MGSRDQNQPPPPSRRASFPLTAASHHHDLSFATMTQPRSERLIDYYERYAVPKVSFATPTRIKRSKRGRPRKLGIGPTKVPSSSRGHFLGTSSQPSGSGKKQSDALDLGTGFTPHVILVNAGEDIAETIVAFSQQGSRSFCILSAIGAVRSVMLKPHSMYGAPVSYEGWSHIISLSGSFLFEEGDTGENNGLNVTFAGSDGRVLGGVVAGMLIAANRVQVMVGIFVRNEKKPVGAANPPSQEPSSQSSDEDEDIHNPILLPRGIDKNEEQLESTVFFG